MKKIQTDVIIIGSGSAALMGASRFAGLEKDIVILNPFREFNAMDFLPRHGMGLWNLSYFTKNDLNELYDKTLQRIREIYPASIESSGFKRIDCWSLFSSVPVHREKTIALEREFFKIERKSFASGQYHLMSADYVHAFGQQIDFQFQRVAQIDGAVQRSYACVWNPFEIASQLIQYAERKFEQKIFYGSNILETNGQKILVETPQDGNVWIEANDGVYVFLTGDLIFPLKKYLQDQDTIWLNGIRKRRRERNYAWFEEQKNIFSNENIFTEASPVWVELGSTHYLKSENSIFASWTTRKGPDGLDRVVDECLRLKSNKNNNIKFTKESRSFWIEWEWINPSWKKTKKNNYIATAFEGDLPATMELLWNLSR